MYETTTADVIQTLKNLLGDDYTLGLGGANLIRELVQNADDAPATRLDFVLWTDGLPGAKNRFLHGPALIYLNDGPFTSRDAAGLTMLVGGSKGDAPEKVGRFGLGQKSVYQICEAFFYSGAESDEGEMPQDWINPWRPGDREVKLGLRRLPEWHEYLEEDQCRVAEVLGALRAQLGCAGQRGLAVWLPLRQQEHAQNGSLLKPESFCDAALVRPWLQRAVTFAELLPFCKHLTEIRTWEASAGGTRQLIEVRREGPGLSRAPDHAQGRPGSHCRVLSGEGLVLDAWSQERYSRDLGEDLRGKVGWPQRTTVVDGAWRDEPEKAVGHGAVVVLRWAEGHAAPNKVQSRLAVYFPLAPQRHSDDDLSVDFEIVLHGSFIPSSNRKHVLGLTDHSERTPDQELRETWNLFAYSMKRHCHA